MAVDVREPGPARSLDLLAPEDGLPVDGVLPPELNGCFLQSVPHPAAYLPPGGHRAAAGPHTFAGVRVEDGGARWFRGALRVRPDRPLGPVPAIAPAVSLGGPDRPPTTVARPVGEAGSPLWHAVACHPGLGHAEHLVVDPDGELLRATPFALEGAPLMQAVALTRRFVVVLDLPVCYGDAAALVGARFPCSWRAHRPARIGLIPRWSETAEPRWFTVDPCYVFQSANAYDEGDRVGLDATAHPRAFDTAPDGWSSRSRTRAAPGRAEGVRRTRPRRPAARDRGTAGRAARGGAYDLARRLPDAPAPLRRLIRRNGRRFSTRHSQR